VDPVPDPLLLRKSGSAGNRTRTSRSVARNPDHWTTEAVQQGCNILIGEKVKNSSLYICNFKRQWQSYQLKVTLDSPWDMDCPQSYLTLV
jgi:hypothetical protein